MFFGGAFEIIFTLMFVLFLVVFIVTFAKGISNWHKNNNSPKLTVDAVVVSKRTNVSHSSHANAGDMTGAHGYTTTSSTTYYVTFEFESRDRLELHVSGREYGQLAEGDKGKLTFQGTRYLSFVRNV